MASRWLTAMMVDDCLHDPVLAAKLILGVELPPHERVRIHGMWKHKFFLDSSGYSTAKSFCLGLVAILRVVLMEDRVGGLISKSFGQGKNLWTTSVNRWINTSQVFRNEVARNRQGELRNRQGSDAHELILRNGSMLRMIPPDFMRDSDRVAGERWNDGYFDEWTLYGNYDTLRVLVSRVTRPVHESYNHKDPIFTNHIAFVGTAENTWHPTYKFYEGYHNKVKQGDPLYDVQSWTYEHYPERFSRLVEHEMIDYMKTTMTREAIDRLVYGKWVKDSAGWYNQGDVEACRSAACPVMTVDG